MTGRLRAAARYLSRVPLLVAVVVVVMALSWALVDFSNGREEALPDLLPPSESDAPGRTPTPATSSASPSKGPSASGKPTATRSGRPPGSPSRRPSGEDSEPPASTPAAPPPTGGRWQPAPGTAWHWQLTGPLDMDVAAPVYDIDGFDHSAAVVDQLHQRDVKVICYVNVGAWENWRSDAGAFRESLMGNGNGWEGERWLDIRQLDALRPLIAARFDMCRDKGFDAVEPDLMDGFSNDTGFPLSAADQLAYNHMIAELAHARGLSVGLKNDLEQIPQLVDSFDFAVNESCVAWDECHLLTPFIDAGKAVFHVEYTASAEEFCAQSRSLELSSMVKREDLDAWSDPCW